MDKTIHSDFPILETDRLLLRQLVEEDAQMLHQYWSDQEVTEFFTEDPFATVEESLKMVVLLKSLLDVTQGIRWAIARKKDDRVLGTCGFHNVKPEHSRAEMGYELGKEYWRQGIMSEALTAIIAYGFDVLKLNRIEAFVNFGNKRSTGILEKIGFTQDGLLRNYEFARGKFVDQYCYSLLKSDKRV
jgi:ribosomal-protein-alanine N-acetyltransferase